MRLRLLLWFGFFLAILIAGFGFAACRIQKTTQLGRIDAGLAERVDLVSRAFRQGDNPGPPPGDEMDFESYDLFEPPPRHGHPPLDRPRAPIQFPEEVVRQFGVVNIAGGNPAR